MHRGTGVQEVGHLIYSVVGLACRGSTISAYCARWETVKYGSSGQLCYSNFSMATANAVETGGGLLHHGLMSGAQFSRVHALRMASVMSMLRSFATSTLSSNDFSYFDQ